MKRKPSSLCIDLQSSFFTGSALLDVRRTSIRPRSLPIVSASLIHTRRSTDDLVNLSTLFSHGSRKSRVSTDVVETFVAENTVEDIESLFSKSSVDENKQNRTNKKLNGGASSVSSGVRLENMSKTYKGVIVLKDVSWEVKKGEKVGLVGSNGAGKTTQLRIIAGLEEPDLVNVIKVKQNMKIAFLSRDFEVSLSRTVKEEFTSAFNEEMEIAGRIEKVQKALESTVEDLALMGRLLDELDLLQKRAQAVDLDEVDVKINKMMPELGFSPEDSDRLVASFSSGENSTWCTRGESCMSRRRRAGPERRC